MAKDKDDKVEDLVDCYSSIVVKTTDDRVDDLLTATHPNGQSR